MISKTDYVTLQSMQKTPSYNSVLAMLRSFGVLNSHPAMSILLHEANEAQMFIKRGKNYEDTDTHNPREDEKYSNSPLFKQEDDWNEMKNSNNILGFELQKSMRLLNVNYHLPIVYIHNYLTKMNF